MCRGILKYNNIEVSSMQNVNQTTLFHTNKETLKFSILDYAGRLAIWGALPVLLDTGKK